MIDNSTLTANITQQVIAKIGRPVSILAVVASIESMGIREKDVLTDFGYNTIYDLGEYIYHQLLKEDPSTLLNQLEQKNQQKAKHIPVSDYLWVKAKLLAQYYPLGIFHMLPVFIQIVAIILFGYSLWTYIGFNIIQSTAVVLGVILGLVVSGGYVQVIGRQASFYWQYGEYNKAKFVIEKLVWAGILGFIKVFIIIGIVNLLFNLYPFSFITITFTYAFLIGLLLLVTAPFHTIKQRWAITVAVFIATTCALLLKEYTSLNIYFTHWIGILIGIGISKLILSLYFKKHQSLFKADVNSKPKQLVVIYKNYRYFFYGILIYVFVFTDRLLAWSTDINLTRKFIFMYEKDYEIGMDIAILIFFMLAGVMEYAIASFSKLMDIRQKNMFFTNRQKFNSSLKTMYWGHISALLGTAIVAAILIYLVITQPWGYQATFGEQLATVSITVSIIGIAGYFFLTWGMLNVLYLFTLGQAGNALKSIFIATTVNFGIGFLLSRLVSYEYSVIGMLIGAIVFMLLTLRDGITFFKKLDYYYYAAY